MRNILFLLFIITALQFNSCQKGRPVDIDFLGHAIAQPTMNTGLSHHFILKDIPGVSSASYAKLIDAQPSYIMLTIEYGEQNLDFVQQAFLYTTKNGVKQEIAYQTDLPITNYSTVQLYPSQLDMREHIRQPLFDMELKLIFRAIPSTETKIRVNFGVQGRLED